ncbi:uncharacterized protein LOC128127195 [Lactuca sativa]|uniref:uncharacterized protein LOC128127195 n=1 Tax=Lactuca sativa TaxID=4236 RepID=UPI0022AEBB6B|nr:uncharacterized protein LOC128127195 [Lactuca sativa]
MKEVPQDEKDKLISNIKAMRVIRLKELYSTDADLEHSTQTFMLSEFGDFKQKPEENLSQTSNRYNHLLSKMIKHGIERKVINKKVTFMNGLRPEWIAIVSTVKAHKQFKSYSLAKLVGILKSHESVVTKETKVVFGMGSFALISKGKSVAEEEPETDLSDNDLTSEKYALMVSNPKRFARKKFPTTKNRNWQGSYSSEKSKEENKSSPQKEEEKKEIKLNEFGGVEIWSTDSEDEEVCKPTDGRAFVAKEDGSSFTGSCLMVTNDVSQMRGYTTDGGYEETKERRDDKCFAAKPVCKQINECDQLIKKIHKRVFTFLELKEDEIDVECYKCESIFSLNETSDAYKIGLDKIESFIKSKDHKDMLKNLIDENESDMSEIYVEDDVDCSEFVKNGPLPVKDLISENSVEFTRISQNQPKTLKAKATVFPKVQTVPNQVFATGGLDKNQTIELTSIINEDNKDVRILLNKNVRGIGDIRRISTKGRSFGNPKTLTAFAKKKLPIKKRKQGSFAHKSSSSKKFIEKPKFEHSQPMKASIKDVKGKGKLNSGRKEELREFRALKDGGCVKYGNNFFGTIKGYGMITNGDFSIRKVAYVEGLQHNLISVSQLVVGTGLKVSFNEERS